MRKHAILVCLLSGIVPTALADDRINDLVKQLGSSHFQEREQATKELIAVGAPALEALRKASQNDDLEVARRAKACIPEIENNGKVAAFVVDLKNDDPKKRAAAADGLMDLRRNGKAAVPALTKALSDEDQNVRERVVVALGLIGGPEAEMAVPKLIELLKDQKTGENLRWVVVTRLADIGGARAEEAAPLLLKLLESDSALLRLGAASSLGKLGQKQKAVVPSLIKALKDPDTRVVASAAAALGGLGKEAEECVPALVQALRSLKNYRGDNDPRVAILGAFDAFGEKSSPAVPVLTDYATDKNVHVFQRIVAIDALGAIGVSAKTAIPALKELSDSGDSEIAPAAWAALGKIQGRKQ